MAETLPHSRRTGNIAEERWLLDCFSRCEAVDDTNRILQGVHAVLQELPLSLVDALHISAARMLAADEFITTGGRKKAQSAALFGIRQPAVVKLPQ